VSDDNSCGKKVNLVEGDHANDVAEAVRNIFVPIGTVTAFLYNDNSPCTSLLHVTIIVVR